MNLPKNNTFTNFQLLLILLLLFFFVSGVTSVLGNFIIQYFLDTDVSQLPNLITSENIPAIYVSVTASQVGVFLLPSLILFTIFNRGLFYQLTFPPKNIGTLLLIGIGTSLLGESALYLNQKVDFYTIHPALGEWVQHTFQQSQHIVALLTSQKSGTSFTLNILIMCLLPAVGEELFFRGAIQPLLIKISNRISASIVFTAFLFAFIHFDFIQFLPRFVLAVVYGIIAHRTQNIGYTIALHFLNNVLALSLVTFEFNTSNISLLTAITFAIIGRTAITYGIRRLK